MLLCTDDAKDYAAFAARYGAKLVSRGSGYATRNVVRDPSLPRHRKGEEALIDALLLAHTDFLLKGTSSLSEFAIWYNAHLIEAHLDLQLTGAALSSPAYTSRLPTWFGGPRQVAELTTKERDDMLQELAAPAAAIAPAAPVVKTKQLGRRRNSGLPGGKRSGGRWAGTFDSKAGRGRRNGRRPRGWRTRGDPGSTPVPDWPRQLSFDPHLMGESLRGLPSLPRPAPGVSAACARPRGAARNGNQAQPSRFGMRRIRFVVRRPEAQRRVQAVPLELVPVRRT